MSAGSGSCTGAPMGLTTAIIMEVGKVLFVSLTILLSQLSGFQVERDAVPQLWVVKSNLKSL